METIIQQKTPFYNYHIALSAKMAPFAGFMMPIQYSSIQQEHTQVRNGVGLFDVSHMGEFMIRGAMSKQLLQWITTNDISLLESGKCQYSCLINNDGCVIDDLLVYCIEKDQCYMLVVNASNIEKDWAWIVEQNKIFSAQIEDVSKNICLLSIQGPRAMDLLYKLLLKSISIPYYRFASTSLLGIDDVVISATGYTGAGGVEIYFKYTPHNAQKVWEAIMEEGKPYGILPCGLGARDTLRLEKGYCLYGHELNETITPLEAGLEWIVKWNKDFIAKDKLSKQKKEGGYKTLVGFYMIEKGIPRAGCIIKDSAGDIIGEVTSGTQSISLQKAIGMGFVKSSYVCIDTNVYIDIRGKLVMAKVCKLPFL